MTQQRLEEKKAAQEVFSRLRVIRRKNRKLRELMGNEAYDEYVHQRVMKADEEYCRTHPGVHVVKVGDYYVLKNTDSTAQP
jgi:hypothetical protein